MEITGIRILAFTCCLVINSSFAQEGGESIAGSGDDVEVTGAITNTGSTQKGRTPEFGYCYRFSKMDFKAASWIEQDLLDAKWPDQVTIDDEVIDRPTWIEIDSCARTAMAEIGTEKSCRSADGYHDYAAAWARLVANRAKQTRKKAVQKASFDSLMSPMKASVEDDYQYSVWNDDAKIKDGTPCPAKYGPNASTWNEYLQLCKLAVLKDSKGEARIRVRTPDMTDDMTLYTSGCKMHYQRICEGYTKRVAEVGPTKISDYACFEMWKDNHAKRTKAQLAECSQQARKCCTPNKQGDRVIQEQRARCDSEARTWYQKFPNPADKEVQKQDKPKSKDKKKPAKAMS